MRNESLATDIGNRTYQQQIAEKLIRSLGMDGAIEACFKNRERRPSEEYALPTNDVIVREIRKSYGLLTVYNIFYSKDLRSFLFLYNS